MTHPLNLPNMVKQVLLEGQGWSPDHPAWLPLTLILAWDLELESSKIYDACLAIYILPNLIEKRKRKCLDMQQKQWLLMARVSELTFIYLLRLAITTYCPLACGSIEASLKLMHCLLLYIVYGYPLNWIEFNYIYFYFFIFDIKDTNGQSYGL